MSHNSCQVQAASNCDGWDWVDNVCPLWSYCHTIHWTERPRLDWRNEQGFLLVSNRILSVYSSTKPNYITPNDYRALPFFFTQLDNKDVYPPEFNFFVDKKMLFKVEVSDGNVNRKWRNYGVKKATDDVEIIDEFIKKYSLIKVIISCQFTSRNLSI